MNTIIRPAQPGDLEEIEALEQVCFSAPWTRQALESQLGAGHIFLVAADGAHILGYVGAMYVLDEGYISNIAVSPAFRRRGVARLLLEALLETGWERKLAFLTLEVRRSNLPAIALYQALQFKPVGLRKRYYEKPVEDAILMTRYLNDEKTDNT